jgi:hypothetical protein
MGLMAEQYTDFKRRHQGETIYVVGSGATLDHVPRGFFDDKTTVCINRSGEALGLKEFYSVSHYHVDAHILADARPDLPVIVPMVEQGIGYPAKTRPTQANVFFVETNAQMYSAFDCAEHWPTHTDHLVCGPTSLHMGMHFAAYLGAKFIILAGADCGILDERDAIEGYAPGDPKPYPVWEQQLPKVAKKLRSMGVGVMSLNPFVNLTLEGHSFRSPSVSINC